ncbi:hypothetical protein AAES_06857 [Amazona aestiva]|uniref:S100/CaBP-9k-type calcium binding subdomain domain-containing protein n=1 Tax=Amazona aestiva TaxID=12930 RepID=A0A0Q3X9A5_AMAAE|nr:hypothetical protein AAES_06857 [Amazona aestiva]
MSKLIKAITDMMESYQGNAKKGKKSEPFSRSEFKKLIQQEFAPVKGKGKKEPETKEVTLGAMQTDMKIHLLLWQLSGEEGIASGLGLFQLKANFFPKTLVN